MAEVHRIARVAVGADRDEAVRRSIDARPAAGTRQAITADQPELQIAPEQQQASPRHQRGPAVMQRHFDRGHGEWAEHEGLRGRAAKPMPQGGL